MRSFPNMIPFPPAEVTRIARMVAPLRFERIYGAFWDRDLVTDAHQRVQESADRYVAWRDGSGTDAPSDDRPLPTLEARTHTAHCP
jgi:hypothetical protein